MKSRKNKFWAAAVAAAVTLFGFLCALFSGCAKGADYLSFVSEIRSDILTYADDDLSFALNVVEREQPYNADGICGQTCALWELSAQFANNPQSVEIRVGEFSGEMNYEAVKNAYVLSFTAPPPSSDNVEVELTRGDNVKKFSALSVRDGSEISWQEALNCVRDFDGELFSSLTDGGNFKGEIYVRLLFDEGCYYYVGVCDRQKNISAYLVDGGTGKIITTKKIKG